MKESDIRFAKLLVLVCGAVPLALLIWDQAHNRLGANPQNFIILTTGMMTLIFLMLTMAVTPVRKSFWFELGHSFPPDARTLRIFLRLPAFSLFLQP